LSRESAGGASVDYYSYAYTQDPIISGMIAESGSVTSFSNPAPKDNSKFWNEAAKNLSCPVDNVKASIACMRTKSMEDVLRASKVDNPLQAVLGHFGPTVDEKVVFSDYKERAAAGKFIQKPYMNGNNDYEAGLFVLIGGAAKIKILNQTWPVFNAATFTCPVLRAVQARTKAGLTTYRYRYFGDYPNTRLQPSTNFGAWHTAEIPQIFMTTESVTGFPNTPSEAKLSSFMQKTWAAFAKDPLSLQKAPFNLPAYANDDFKKTLIGFGAYENVSYALLSPIDYDMYCETIENILTTIPGGISQAITNVAYGGDMGVPGLKIEELPDMSPRPLAPYSSATLGG
jgi:cholinesterase